VDSPEGIAGHGASIVNDTMVVFGGYHGHGTRSGDISKLQLTIKVFHKVNALYSEAGELVAFVWKSGLFS
jgi:hypothetical protein